MPKQEVGRHVRRMRDHNRFVDLRGTSLDASRARQILAEISPATGTHISVPVAFNGARITGELSLSNVKLSARLDFAGSRVDTIRIGQSEGLANLRLGDTQWERTKIGTLIVSDCLAPIEELAITEVDVDDRLSIRRSHLRSLFLYRMRLGDRCMFSDIAVDTTLSVLACSGIEINAEGVRVEDGVSLQDLYTERMSLTACSFGSWTDAESTGSLSARRCVFGGPTSIRWAPYQRVAERLRQTDPGRPIPIDGVRPPDGDTSTSLRSVRFTSTAHLRVSGGDVELPGCVFSDASTLAEAEQTDSRPRLTDVTEMDGDELRIGNVDVSSCKLAAAASLGPIDPGGLQLGFGAVGVTHRHFLADEGSRPPLSQRLKRRSPSRQAAQVVAATYRDLRISSERIGNHVGSNDFYYGERLWQRKASRRGSIDWLWLAAYGSVGYGVRPLRPFAWLVAVVIAGALAFSVLDGIYRERVVAGAPTASVKKLCEQRPTVRTPASAQRVSCPADLSEALEFTVRTTTTLIRPVGGFEMRGLGVALDIVLRLVAALLFALLVLAVRNRVRRG